MDCLGTLARVIYNHHVGTPLALTANNIKDSIDATAPSMSDACETRTASEVVQIPIAAESISTHRWPCLFLGLLLLLLGLRCRQLERLGLAVLAVADLLPGAAAALKVAERLGQLQGLGDDALLLFVEADLGVAGEGEVLAQRVALEAVVGHDAAEIRMADEEDAEQVVHLALVPVGAREKAGDAGNGGGLVGVGLDADAGVVPDAEEVVDDLETLVPRGVVDGRDGGDLGELGGRVI